MSYEGPLILMQKGQQANSTRSICELRAEIERSVRLCRKIGEQNPAAAGELRRVSLALSVSLAKHASGCEYCRENEASLFFRLGHSEPPVARVERSWTPRSISWGNA